jgi:hypothetical protein
VTTPFGTPTQVQPRSIVTTLVVEPVVGLDVSHSALNISDNATPSSDNFIMRDGRLELRSVLSRIGDRGFATVLTGGVAANSVNDARYLVVAGRGSDWPWLGPGDVAWNSAPNTAVVPTSGDYWDFAQIFSDIDEENIVVGAVTSRGTQLSAWVVGTGAVRALAGSPGARYVAAFDNYLMAANTEEDGNSFPQRVRWADRGSASSWTGGISGYEDLLAARGGITRLLTLEKRVIVLFEDEVWQGIPIDFPYTFRFEPLDSTVGCPFPWTATVTTKGIVFMARNYQLYLLPKDGGTAVPIGPQVHRRIRESIVQPLKAFGAYDGVNDFYHFYYSSGASANFANRALWLNFATGAWAPQSFDTQRLALTRAFTAPLSSSKVSTWDDFTNFQPAVTWNDMVETWDELSGVGNERQAVVALSATTVFEYSDVMRADSLESSTGSTSGVTRNAFWQSKPLGSDMPDAEKTLLRVTPEYVAPSASSVTVRTSPSQGAAFDTGFALSLRTASTVSQAYADVFQPARYPMFRIEASEQTALELHRFFITMRVGGR